MVRTLNKLCAHGHNNWGETVSQGKPRRYCLTCNAEKQKDFKQRQARKNRRKK